MKIKIKYNKDQDNRLQSIEQGDWIDLHIMGTYLLKQNQYTRLPLGVYMKLPENMEAHILPRSSTFEKYGILMANSKGIVDNSYCGDNDMWLAPCLATRDVRIEHGTRLFQFRLVEKMQKPSFEVVDFLEDESRGGFGSTGK